MQLENLVSDPIIGNTIGGAVVILVTLLLKLTYHYTNKFLRWLGSDTLMPRIELAVEKLRQLDREPTIRVNWDTRYPKYQVITLEGQGNVAEEGNRTLKSNTPREKFWDWRYLRGPAPRRKIMKAKLALLESYLSKVEAEKQ